MLQAIHVFKELASINLQNAVVEIESAADKESIVRALDYICQALESLQLLSLEFEPPDEPHTGLNAA